MGRIIKTVKSSGVGHIRGFQLGTSEYKKKRSVNRNGDVTRIDVDVL